MSAYPSVPPARARIQIFVCAHTRYVLFGPHMRGYATFTWALQSQFEMMLGNHDTEHLLYIAPRLAPAFTICYIFLVGMVRDPPPAPASFSGPHPFLFLCPRSFRAN